MGNSQDQTLVAEEGHQDETDAVVVDVQLSDTFKSLGVPRDHSNDETTPRDEVRQNSKRPVVRKSLLQN